MEEVIERMRTFSILNWCGMPFDINPRKCAKMGYRCHSECILTCADDENCGVDVSLPKELAFNRNPVAIEGGLIQLR